MVFMLNSVRENEYRNYYRTDSAGRTAANRMFSNTPSYPAAPDTDKTVLSGLLLALVSLTLNKVSGWCGNKLMAGKEFTSAENSKKIAGEMAKNNKLNVITDYIDHANKGKYGAELAQTLEPVANGQNAFFMDKALRNASGEIKGLAVAPKSKPSLMLHELGHAINASKGGLLKFMQKTRGFVSYIPTALLLLNGVKNDPDKSNFIERNAGKLGFLAFLPTILEEGLASIRGVNAAKAAEKAGQLAGGVKLDVLKRNYFFAWMTYLLSGIGLGIAARQAFLEKKHKNS
ncbi:MAG: hypothetical protein LBK53_04505 [Heliobacteriaceae bacterium]|nr:hypothetical protein [Heliobacteriaceae bacterium]